MSQRKQPISTTVQQSGASPISAGSLPKNRSLFTVLTGPEPGRIFALDADELVFGREEPAVGRIANARFGEREFGTAVKERVPAGEPVFVVNITKAQALRYFAERDLVFVDEPEHLAAAIAGRTTAYVVARGKDLKDLKKLGTVFESAAVEPYETTAKAENLLIVTP